MNEVISWVVFAGSWLLVAGPLYQGSVELAELDFDREGIEGIKVSFGQLEWPDPPSAWWWLFWVLVVAMLAAAMLNTAARMSGDQRTRLGTDAEPVPAAD